MNMSKKMILSLIAWLVMQSGFLNTVAEASNYSLIDANGKVLKTFKSNPLAGYPSPWRVMFSKSSLWYALSVTSAVKIQNGVWSIDQIWSSKRKPHMPLTLNMGKNNFIQITKEGSIEFEPVQQAEPERYS